MTGPAPVADDRCARCGGAFHCGAQDPQPCACSRLRLAPATLARLRTQYAGCLCIACLAAEAAADPAEAAAGAAGTPAPAGTPTP